MRALIISLIIILVAGCRSSHAPDLLASRGDINSLPDAKSKADLVLLCSAIHSGDRTEHEMVCSLYTSKDVKMAFKPGDIVSTFTRYSSKSYFYDSVLIIYEMRGTELHELGEIAVYGDDVPAFRMRLSDVIEEFTKP
ncbi:hypothetical protein HW115_19090 [Verrucomicrobiaceae bacterium N1E253]|uniref:Lipoprotein n=1 Tax=Oceaniferula marina TaxID=2748318 RepID=A0A851GKZ9_9BACT|nr:hypothetical protein [Oceaniferula marina]NWK57732.1 hypothetical protein [Oceaniferula marina]